MRIRNPVRLSPSVIDVELEHETHSWIPYTAMDGDPSSQSVYDAAVAGEGGEIKQGSLPQPSAAELRAREYPSVGDQLDAIWKAMEGLKAAKLSVGAEAEAMLTEIKRIKLENPINEQTDPSTTRTL